MTNKINISFTTIPSRTKDLKKIILSLIDQHVKPDKIYINIPKNYDRFDDEVNIPDLSQFNDLVEVFYLEKDYGPATKFIGSLLNPKITDDDYIVITDDDVLKLPNWLELLYNNHQDTRITCFEERRLGKEIIWGYLGYIFKKNILKINDLIDFYQNVKNDCNLVDDHWLTGYCHFKKIDIYNIPILNYKQINDSFQFGASSDSLVNLKGDNTRALVSERCRNTILKEYNTTFPFWCCLGCCPRKKIEYFNNVSPISIPVIYILFISAILVSINSNLERNNKIIYLIINIILVCYICFKRHKEIEGFSKVIPKVIIQTYKDKSKIPDKVYKNIKEFAPDYQHLIFDDNECLDFLIKYYSENTISAFNKLKGAHRADLFRYCYLYIHGGIYLDIKTELLTSISNTINLNLVYTVLSFAQKKSIYQGLIASPPKNNLFLKLIEFIVNVTHLNKPFDYHVFTSDFYNQIEKYCKAIPKKQLNINKIDNNNFYLFDESCSKDENKCKDGLDRWGWCCYILDNGKKVFKVRYSDYPW